MRKGFTLIELLVVIGVILILASLLVVGLAAVLRETKSDEAQITVSQMSTGMAKMKAECNLFHKPLALYIDRASFVDYEKPTIAELQARTPLFNLAVELCPKRIYTELVYQSPSLGQWPFVNARKRSRDLPTADSKSYDFGTYFEPNGRQLLKIGGSLTTIIDPWQKPYEYLVFQELIDVMQPDGVTIVQRPIFYEIIASAGPDIMMDKSMTNYTSAGGFLDFAAHPENEDNIYVEVDKWSPKK